jgi:hypothetical protein
MSLQTYLAHSVRHHAADRLPVDLSRRLGPARTSLVMTGAGIQVWVLCLMGLRSAHAYQEIAPVLEVMHVLGHSCRLASLGAGSSVLYGRFALGFCRALLIGVVGDFASRHLRQAGATFGARFAPSRLGISGDRRFDLIK